VAEPVEIQSREQDFKLENNNLVESDTWKLPAVEVSRVSQRELHQPLVSVKSQASWEQPIPLVGGQAHVVGDLAESHDSAESTSEHGATANLAGGWDSQERRIVGRYVRVNLGGRYDSTASTNSAAPGPATFGASGHGRMGLVGDTPLLGEWLEADWHAPLRLDAGSEPAGERLDGAAGFTLGMCGNRRLEDRARVHWRGSAGSPLGSFNLEEAEDPFETVSYTYALGVSVEAPGRVGEVRAESGATQTIAPAETENQDSTARYVELRLRPNIKGLEVGLRWQPRATVTAERVFRASLQLHPLGGVAVSAEGVGDSHPFETLRLSASIGITERVAVSVAGRRREPEEDFATFLALAWSF